MPDAVDSQFLHVILQHLNCQQRTVQRTSQRKSSGSTLQLLRTKMRIVLTIILCGTLLGERYAYQLTAEDHDFLEDLQRRGFQYFWDHTDNSTGLTLDRAHTNGTAYDTKIASIAATGFALTTYCIAAERNWVAKQDLIARTTATLQFFVNGTFQKEGWFYHWMHSETGDRRWNSEISSIDTALLLGGVLSVRKCFKDEAIVVEHATLIFERVNFQWMLNGHESWLSHGWKPESGFLESRWTDYSEQTMLNLLAIGSPDFPVPWESWYALKRHYRDYEGYQYIAAVPPLFIHQYSHAFFDYRNRRETFSNYTMDYFGNSVNATLAQRSFFANELSKEFPFYSSEVWGLTASDSQNGYKAWGAPPREADIDGTVVPCAAGGSLMFAPNETINALKVMKELYPNIYGMYGFADAFNPHNRWINGDVIGIDVGITVLSAENARTGNVWKWFMENEEAHEAFRIVQLMPPEPSSTASTPSSPPSSTQSSTTSSNGAAVWSKPVLTSAFLAALFLL